MMYTTQNWKAILLLAFLLLLIGSAYVPCLYGQTQKIEVEFETVVCEENKTLWKIAGEHYGNPYLWPLIAYMNKLPEDKKIPAGTTVYIPVVETKKAVLEEELTQKIEVEFEVLATVVYEGDKTLREMAEEHYGNEDLWPLIAYMNKLSEDTEIPAGTTIYIPVPERKKAVAGVEEEPGPIDEKPGPEEEESKSTEGEIKPTEEETKTTEEEIKTIEEESEPSGGDSDEQAEPDIEYLFQSQPVSDSEAGDVEDKECQTVIAEQAKKQLESGDASKEIIWSGDSCGCVLDFAEEVVYGFYPFWMADGDEQKLNFSVLSRIGYFAVVFDPETDFWERSHWKTTEKNKPPDFVREARKYKTKVDLVIYINISGDDQAYFDEIAWKIANALSSSIMPNGITFYFDFSAKVARRLFCMELQFQKDLEDKNFSEQLREQFKNSNITLSQEVTIRDQAGKNEWIVSDDDSGINYTIRKEDNSLKIYEGLDLEMLIQVLVDELKSDAMETIVIYKLTEGDYEVLAEDNKLTDDTLEKLKDINTLEKPKGMEDTEYREYLDRDEFVNVLKKASGNTLQEATVDQIVEQAEKKIIKTKLNINIMLPMSAIGKDAYSWVNLYKINKYIDLFLVFLEEPTTKKKKDLRIMIERYYPGKGKERRDILRKIVPVIPVSNFSINEQQFYDDLIYFEDNFGGVGLWPVPVKKENVYYAVNKEIIKVFYGEEDRGLFQSLMAVEDSWYCKIVCPNRWYFRWAMDILMGIFAVHFLLWFFIIDLRTLFNHSWCFLGYSILLAFIFLSLNLCDPWYAGLRGLFFVLFILLLIAVFVCLYIRRRKRATFP